MHPHRSVFASVLLAAVLLGGTLGPAVHWASHGLGGHHQVAHATGNAHATEAAQAPDQHCPHDHGVATSEEHAPVDSEERDGQPESCIDCVYLQQVAGSEATALSFVVKLVGHAPSALTPESPVTEADVTVPGERGPPEVG